MLEKIKKFFSPIKGGLQDGFTFKKFILSFRRMGPLLFIIGLSVVLILTDKESFAEIGWYYGMLSAFVGIIILYMFKTLQHWNDLKNHTSR